MTPDDDREYMYIDACGVPSGCAWGHDLDAVYDAGLRPAAAASAGASAEVMGCERVWVYRRLGDESPIMVAVDGRPGRAWRVLCNALISEGLLDGWALRARALPNSVLSALAAPKATESHYNGKCLVCGAPAYVGLVLVECSAGSKCGEPEPEPVVDSLWVSRASGAVVDEIGYRVHGAPRSLVAATPEAARAAWRRYRQTNKSRPHGL